MCMPLSCIFDHFHHFALCLNAIQSFVFNFAGLSRNDLIVDMYRQITLFRYMKVSCLISWLFWAYQPFETVFQSISQRDGERKS